MPRLATRQPHGPAPRVWSHSRDPQVHNPTWRLEGRSPKEKCKGVRRAMAGSATLQVWCAVTWNPESARAGQHTPTDRPTFSVELQLDRSTYTHRNRTLRPSGLSTWHSGSIIRMTEADRDVCVGGVCVCVGGVCVCPRAAAGTGQGKGTGLPSLPSQALHLQQSGGHQPGGHFRSDTCSIIWPDVPTQLRWEKI